MTNCRKLLVATSAVVASTSGCLSWARSGDRTESTGWKASFLENVKISNHHPEEHTVDVLIERDGEIVHWSDYHVDAFDVERKVAGTELITPPAFEHERGRWAVAARLRSTSSGQRIRLRELPHRGGCLKIVVRVTEDGEVRFLYDTPDCQRANSARR